MFLHEDTGSATNGCVTLGRAQLLVTLRWLQPAREPAIAIVAGTGGA
jgi:L,D-peptidoglycan transpeptidase YkuD (ErfK/YbiS/YcfS/YnhG family)